MCAWVLTTAPTAITASKLPLIAMALAINGSSNEPGTQATCMQCRNINDYKMISVFTGEEGSREALRE